MHQRGFQIILILIEIIELYQSNFRSYFGFRAFAYIPVFLRYLHQLHTDFHNLGILTARFFVQREIYI